VLRGHRLEVWRLALLPDHTTLVSGCKDGTVSFWDTSVRHPHEARITLPEPMSAWCFAPDSQSVVTSDAQGSVTRWRGRDFRQSETLHEIGTNRYPACDLLSSDGRWLTFTTTDNVIHVWDLLRGRPRRELTNQTGKISAQSFSSDGNRLVRWLGDTNVLREWDLNSNSSQPIHSWGVPGKYSTITSSPDQRMWLVAEDGPDALCEELVSDGGVKTNLDVREIAGAAFSPDGKLFAVASMMGYARVWETATWRPGAPLRGYLLGVHSVVFSGDGKRLVTGAGKEALKLWDTVSWQEVLTLEGQGSVFSPTAISPDGDVIGTMSMSGIVQLWRAPSWAEINAAEAAEKQGQRP
jgi:WD40 repeat protein